jgi:hypothetical protein
LGRQAKVINDAKLLRGNLEAPGKRVPDAASSLGQTRAPTVDSRLFDDLHHPRITVTFVYRSVSLAHLNSSLPLRGPPDDQHHV